MNTLIDEGEEYDYTPTSLYGDEDPNEQGVDPDEEL